MLLPGNFCLAWPLLLVALLLRLKLISATQTLTDAAACDGLFFATFNIQNFGVSKASKPAVLRALSETMARYDLIAIQELSQLPSGVGVCGANTMSAICDLHSDLNAASFRSFSVVASPRIGDEQYALFYNSARVVYVDGATYPDPDSKHSRPPHAFHVMVGDTSLIVAMTHTKPTDATTEIQNFPNVMTWMQTVFGNQLMMIVGDYNADGSYFNEDTSWSGVLAQLPGYSLRTGNELDTTVAVSSNTYDRIIASDALVAEPPSVFVIEKHVSLSSVLTEGCADNYVKAEFCGVNNLDWSEITKELSDHYPVQMCLRLATNATVTTTTTTSTTVRSLAPGDCAVVGMHSDSPDNFGIVLLVDILVGQKIFATDAGVLADGSLRSSEGILSYSATSEVSAGTVLMLSDFSTVERGGFALSSSGDQIVVFVGSITSPVYVCALNTEGASGTWQTDATSSVTSALPTGLANGVNAIALVEADNVAYTGTTVGFAGELRASINNPVNWRLENSALPPIPSHFIVNSTTTTTTTSTTSTSTTTTSSTTTQIGSVTTSRRLQTITTSRQERISTTTTGWLNVQGTLQLQVDNPQVFIENANVKTALQRVIAEMAGVAARFVQIFLSLFRRLSSPANLGARRLAGAVKVRYVVSFPTGTDTSAKMAEMNAVSTAALSASISTELAKEGVTQKAIVTAHSAVAYVPTTTAAMNRPSTATPADVSSRAGGSAYSIAPFVVMLQFLCLHLVDA